MDKMDKLKEALVDAYGDDFDMDAITPETSLSDDLGLNSIGMLAVAISIEEKFGFKFANDDISAIKNVQDILDIIEKRA